MKSVFKFLLVAMLFAITGCDDSTYKPPPPIDGGNDADIVQDHVSPPDDLDANPDGPQIEITNPLSDQTVASEFLQVKAVITSESSTIDFDSCVVYIEGEYYDMTVDTTVEDGFKATVDLTEIPAGIVLVRVQASDVEGLTNYADVNFNLDKGPSFTIYNPADDERYSGALNLSFQVQDNDGVDSATVTAVIGDVELDLTPSDVSAETANGNPVSISYESEIVFDDSMFSPALTGTQRITLSAVNSLGNSGNAGVDFIIDNTGPVIEVTSHEQGQIIGSIITISANITDDAGVLSSSVFAVIGNNDTTHEIPLSKITGTNTYEGSFDTNVLPSTYLWPALQVFATDLLGNESSVAFELALDNTAPLISLDPPENFRIAKTDSESQIQCSRVLDPVGSGAANDGDLVPQIFWLRARVEDMGNVAAGMAWSPLALVNQDNVELFILNDVSYPLVVDSNGDGYCDDINPELLPTIHLTGNPKETLKLDLTSIPPSGSADYRYDSGELPPVCDLPGDDLTEPDGLCPVTEDDMTIAIWYTFDKQEPAIYTLPPVDTSSSLTCSGIQFDSLANNISEGWACIAVRAVDNAGNIGVSAPLRVCIDYNPYDGNIPADCQNLSNAPDCTGTLDNSVSPAQVTLTPCTPLVFSENEVRRDS
ncbi:MAG: hypothetical protein JXR95_02215 [Deltaproteobacteria bacterium]|nr:hypothetical protein [Deltaproteobacteria bacterium]